MNVMGYCKWYGLNNEENTFKGHKNLYTNQKASGAINKLPILEKYRHFPNR